jgi:hypothetical protein
MKRLVFYLLFIAVHPVTNAQAINSSFVDGRASRFPDAVTSSVESMADYIRAHFNDDESRIRAAYRWVTSNISYDKDSMLSINWSKENDEKIAATLRRKKGVCDNFASLFTAILVKMNIPSYVVNGHCKTTGSVATQAHSWSAVQLKNRWTLCDPTWDIDYASAPKYFLIPGEEFIYTHWPFDPLWQLIPYTVSYAEFERGTIYGDKNKTFINVIDSVKAFAALDPLQQMESSARRMKASGAERAAHKNWYAYNQMNIAIVHGERNMQLYNAAVQDMNQATKIFNQYAAYRNKLFQPVRPDEEIKNILQPVIELIQSAKQKAATIASSKENFQYDTGGLVERINSLNKKVEEQVGFLTRYVSVNAAEREKLFYQ